MPESAAKHAMDVLEDIDDDATFVFIAGDTTGMDCILGHGDTEPAAVHIHLLATYMASLPDLFAEDHTVQDIANMGLETIKEMQEDGAAIITQDYPKGGET